MRDGLNKLLMKNKNVESGFRVVENVLYCTRKRVKRCLLSPLCFRSGIKRLTHMLKRAAAAWSMTVVRDLSCSR